MLLKPQTYTLPLITILLLILLAGFKNQSTASLTGTRWTGVLNLPANDKERGLLVFKKDSLVIYVAGQVIETARYTLNKNIIVFKKISRGGFCSPEQTAKYLFAIQLNVLTLTPVVDNCVTRTNIFSAKGYIKHNNDKKEL